MTDRRSAQQHRRPAPQRRRSPTIDPYTVVPTAITLQDWRRTVAKVPAVHVVRRRDDPLAAA